MTVNTTNITSGPYIGNGASDTYSYTFRVADKTQLSVYETDDAGNQSLLVVDTDYTVNDVGVDAGGTITRLAGNLPTDYQWYIRSNYIENQLTAFASQGGFFPDVHEAQMDHITFLIQQLRDTTTRSFGLSDTIDIDGVFTISDIAADRINKILGFDATGDMTTVTLNEDFITVYLGAKTADPTLDNQGNALIDGALYYNTISFVVKVYDLGTTTWVTVNPSNAAVDITVADTAGYFTGTDVEAVLAELWVNLVSLAVLASTSNGDGASLIGVEDSLGHFTGADVEDVLAELYASGLIQEVNASSNTYIAAFTSTIALDDSIPLITEGTEIETIAITPEFASSTLEFEVEFTGATNSANGDLVIYSLIDVTAGATLYTWIGATDVSFEPVTFHGGCAAASPGTSVNTYSIRAGTATGTLEINGANGSRVLGGALSTKMNIREVK